MNKVRYPLFRVGCLVSLIAPIIAIVLYPRANWLFAFLLLGFALVVVGVVSLKQPTPTEVADRAERLLDGNCHGWDVDDYEYLNPKNPQLEDLWRQTMGIGGLPEEWGKLDDAKKNALRAVIQKIRWIDRGVV
jgi:hypothetical protein